MRRSFTGFAGKLPSSWVCFSFSHLVPNLLFPLYCGLISFVSIISKVLLISIFFLFNRLRAIWPKGYQRGSLGKSQQNGFFNIFFNIFFSIYFFQYVQYIFNIFFKYYFLFQYFCRLFLASFLILLFFLASFLFLYCRCRYQSNTNRKSMLMCFLRRKINSHYTLSYLGFYPTISC